MDVVLWLTTLQFAGVNALFALSIYCSLWTGVLSIAPIFIGATTAFSFGYLVTSVGLSPSLGLLLGIVLGGVLGVVIALLVVRLDTHYLALATIAVVLIGRVLIVNLPSDIAGGAAGTGVPGSLGTWLWLGVCVGAAAWVLARLRGSRFGLAADAVREDPAVAQTLSISPRRIQLVGFVLSGAIAGGAGVMEASFLQYIGPDTFYVNLGFTTLAAVVLGGAYHFAGPIVGAVVFTMLPVLLQSALGSYDQVVTGVLLVVIIVFSPRGLVDLRYLRLIAARVNQRRTPATAPAFDDGPTAWTGS